MKVWIVYESLNEYADGGIVGVFSSQELANTCAYNQEENRGKYGYSFDVEVFTVDE